jgi:hypothetical protein
MLLNRLVNDYFKFILKHYQRKNRSILAPIANPDRTYLVKYLHLPNWQEMNFFPRSQVVLGNENGCQAELGE